ncbi:MAG: VCBS repeat-containing protein [Thermodesulfobacteriaceae bacterium]|nr:VCBS repeat-containing protein [Thermodesulfobacteriaceae bacterium]
MKKFFLFIIIYLFFNKVSLVYSKIYEEVRKDFTPLSTLIIGIEDSKVIIDKGAVQGVKPKDIFTIYKKVKKIVHPETKETLGFLKEPIGKIEISKTEENFSVGRIISKKEEISVPTPAKRFSDLKILVLSEKTSLSENLYLTLKTTLPECEITFSSQKRLSQISPSQLFSEGIDLVFVEDERGIKIYNSYLDLVRLYGEIEYAKVQISSPTLGLSKPQPLGLFTYKVPSPLGKMIGEVYQSEFADLDQDGQLEMVYFNSQGLFVVKIKGGLLARYKPLSGKIVNFSVGHQGWIALNVYEDRVGMRSEILKFSPQGLIPVITNANLILQFVDYTGRGFRDTLIGQLFDPDHFFGKEVYILKRENQQLVYAKRLEVPLEFRSIGGGFADLDRDGQVEIFTYLADGRLAIYKGLNLVWATPYRIVSHFYQVEILKGKRGQEVVKQVVFPLITPVIADLNGDGQKELLFVSANFPLETVIKETRRLPLESAVSQVLVLGYEGTYFFRNLLDQQAGFITGVGVFNNQIFYVLVKGKYPGETESFLYYTFS